MPSRQARREAAQRKRSKEKKKIIYIYMCVYMIFYYTLLEESTTAGRTPKCAQIEEILPRRSAFEWLQYGRWRLQDQRRRSLLAQVVHSWLSSLELIF